MRNGIVWLLSGLALLGSGRCAWAQAGRFIPRVIPGGGRFVPHIPIHFFGQDSDLGTFLLWVVGLIVVAVVLGWVGYHLGWALGGGRKRTGRAPGSAGSWPPVGTPASAGFGPDQRDLILNPVQVEAKAGQTMLLMEFLARQDPCLDPAALRPLVSATFCLVQKCWEARDYGPLRDLLRPGILAEHERLLRQMQQGHEINRIENLRVDAVDFVHLDCPEDPDAWKITALITFEAAVYFVSDRDGTHTRGPRSPGRFQEFWVFRRQGEHWLLEAIERTHQSRLLQAANHVAGLSAEQLQNMQHSIAL
jgi:hypothetical protein